MDEEGQREGMWSLWPAVCCSLVETWPRLQERQQLAVPVDGSTLAQRERSLAWGRAELGA